MISMNNVSIGYDVELIKNFNITIDKPEIIAITGPSGSGKTSLLYTMGMLKEVKHGQLNLFGHTNPSMNSKEGRGILKNNISFIFQNFVLLNEKTVKENLEEFTNDGIFTIEEALEFVGLKGYEKKKVYELSGGEQQRVCIARALIKKFDILLGDEITGNLDVENRDIVFDLVIKIKSLGKTVILVTHDKELAQKCDREICL